MEKKHQVFVIAALLAAMTTIATLIIRIPIFSTNGYINIGDAIVLLSAWFLGNPYGALAAGIGSGLADLLAGYPAYIPGTTVIKFLMAFIWAVIYKLLTKKGLKDAAAAVISSVTAEIWMVLGYLLYESFLLGYGKAALASVAGNATQAVAGVILGSILMVSLKKVKNLLTY